MILFYNRLVHIDVAEPYTWTLGSLVPFIEKYGHALWRNWYAKICYSNTKSLQLETSGLGSKNNAIFNGLIAKSLDFCIFTYSFSFLLLNLTHFLFTIKLCPCSASILQLWPFVSIFAKNSLCLLLRPSPYPPAKSGQPTWSYNLCRFQTKV